MNVYQVTIGPRGLPRLSFEAMAASSVDCFAQHADLAEVGERVEIVQSSKVQDDKRRHLNECGVMA